jgi:hypothetical protein
VPRRPGLAPDGIAAVEEGIEQGAALVVEGQSLFTQIEELA